jgi:broad specificity phosphatase PhoE
MKKIYLVRHGESDANAGGIIRPEDEIELTEHGHEQAAFVGERARNLGIEKIIASTLLRARQTAEHISKATEIPVETSELLIERRFPSGYLGLTQEHPLIKEIIQLLEVRFGDDDANHSDEETFEELRARAIGALQYLQERPEQTILVVTHGIFLRILVAVATFGPDVTRKETGKFVHAFKTKNTGISLLEFDEEKYPHAPWVIRTWNDHAHLAS